VNHERIRHRDRNFNIHVGVEACDKLLADLEAASSDDLKQIEALRDGVAALLRLEKVRAGEAGSFRAETTPGARVDPAMVAVGRAVCRSLV
jgi:hypothetical protein